MRKKAKLAILHSQASLPLANMADLQASRALWGTKKTSLYFCSVDDRSDMVRTARVAAVDLSDGATRAIMRVVSSFTCRR